MVNDFTYLNDEALDKLTNIKKFEDLKENLEKFSSLDEETKKLEEAKFEENSSRAKSIINV
jgi:hypothetical protein